jgi:Acyl-CoA dehydrogenase, C-terminal domain
VARRAQAEALVGLLTPVAKVFSTDNGHRRADEALQVWGGYGYVHEYGIEQCVRDSRIAMIYEGTNEIQAIDLLQRKVLDDGGANLDSLLALLEADARGASSETALLEFSAALESEAAKARAATAMMLDGRASDLKWLLRVADDYLRAIGVSVQPRHLESWCAGADDGVHQRTRWTPCKRQSGVRGAVTRSS